MWRKKKNEIKAARKKKQKLPYKQCGHRRSYTGKNGSHITVICTRNANTIHIHE